jgi:periplasmic nitrate reductase NapE
MSTETKPDGGRRAAELKVFLLLAGLLVPLLSIVGVGGYGLAVWTYQMIAGPPGAGTVPTMVRPASSPK